MNKTTDKKVMRKKSVEQVSKRGSKDFRLQISKNISCVKFYGEDGKPGGGESGSQQNSRKPDARIHGLKNILLS